MAANANAPSSPLPRRTSGSVKKKGGDQNSDARDRLADKIDLYDRMTSPRALGHNKFLVLCDAHDKPRWVWTGNQNWTETGLCTQANNLLLIDNPAVAAEYRKQWEFLRDAQVDTPQDLKDNNSSPRDHKIKNTGCRRWFTSTMDQVDLEEARGLIANARQAILFLMFNRKNQHAARTREAERSRSIS